MNSERSTVVGVFQEIGQAERAVKQLRDAGFAAERLGFLMKDPSKHDTFHRSAIEEVAPDAEEKATETGAVLGGVLGGILGALVAGVFPGVGAAIVGASLVTTIGGGAAAGGLAGHFVGMGLPQKEAEFYKQEYEAGRPILTVDAGERYSEALAIVLDNGAHDLSRPVEQPV